MKAIDLVETIARGIASADQEDYMEDWRRYDDRARSALTAIEAAGFAIVPADVAREMSEVGKLIQETREKIKNGARPRKRRFRL